VWVCVRVGCEGEVSLITSLSFHTLVTTLKLTLLTPWQPPYSLLNVVCCLVRLLFTRGWSSGSLKSESCGLHLPSLRPRFFRDGFYHYKHEIQCEREKVKET